MKRWVLIIISGGRHELVLEKTKVIQGQMEAMIKTGQEQLPAEINMDKE
jgi:hypothetical protein